MRPPSSISLIVDLYESNQDNPEHDPPNLQLARGTQWCAAVLDGSDLTPEGRRVWVRLLDELGCAYTALCFLAL